MEQFFQTHGYVISRESAMKMSNYMDKMLIEQQIDAVWSAMAKNKLINVFCLNKELAVQNSSFMTTIQLPINYKPGVNAYETIQ